MFAFPTNFTEVFNTLSSLKNNEAVANDGVSAEVLKTSLPMIIFLLIDFFQSVFVMRLVLKVSKRRKSMSLTHVG